MPTGYAYSGTVWIGFTDGTKLQEMATVSDSLEYDACVDNIYTDLSSWTTTVHVKNKRRLIAGLGLLLSRGEQKMQKKKMRKWRKWSRRARKETDRFLRHAPL